MAGEFDPYALLHALERQRVTYVVIGGLGRVLHGSGEVTDGLDIVPSTREENLRRRRGSHVGYLAVSARSTRYGTGP
jgi:hypothetical protein